jgi:hypothetical protein
MECLQQDLSSSTAGSSCQPLSEGSPCTAAAAAADGKSLVAAAAAGQQSCKRGFCEGEQQQRLQRRKPDLVGTQSSMLYDVTCLYGSSDVAAWRMQWCAFHTCFAYLCWRSGEACHITSMCQQLPAATFEITDWPYM